MAHGKFGTLPLNAFCSTDGKGLWSNAKRNVKLLRLEVSYVDDDRAFGELRAFFDARAWSVDELGLIYTDPLWIRDFRGALEHLGFSAEAAGDVDYSEQGMQGDSFVSLDVGGAFLKEWFEKLKL